MCRRRVVLCLALISLMLAACNSHSERPPEPDEMLVKGQTLYVEYCAECHQTDGMGWSSLFPRLAGNPIVTLHDPSPLIVTVAYGQGSMPAFSERITSDQIAEILTYIRNSWGNQAPAVAGKQIH